MTFTWQFWRSPENNCSGLESQITSEHMHFSSVLSKRILSIFLHTNQPFGGAWTCSCAKSEDSSLLWLFFRTPMCSRICVLQSNCGSYSEYLFSGLSLWSKYVHAYLNTTLCLHGRFQIQMTAMSPPPSCTSIWILYGCADLWRYFQRKIPCLF